jgi:DNA-binding CsgD family transcriptional regulator
VPCRLAGAAGNHNEATRLFGAAETFRQRTGLVRFKVHQAGYESSVAALRDAMEDREFEAAWAEGAALSIEEAIAYAQRGRGERKRPSSGWESLTQAERDVVRLVCDGLANKDIATRLFVSPKTVQAHLTHVYTTRAHFARPTGSRGGPPRLTDRRKAGQTSGSATLLQPIGQRPPGVQDMSLGDRAGPLGVFVTECVEQLLVLVE